MNQLLSLNDAKDIASRIDAEIQALSVWNTPNERAIRRKYSRKLNQVSPEFMLKVKAMSWALRELVGHDPDAVWKFLRDHAEAFAARVTREVRNKFTTGLKNPRRKSG